MAHIKSLHALNVNFLLACFVLLLSSAGFSAEPPDSASYGIDVWYGKRQVFGRAGTQQPMINIIGQVRSPEALYHLSYNFQRKRYPLPTGPSAFRLATPGEFNIEIDRTGLPAGEYSLRIIAVYNDGTEVREQVWFTLEENTPQLPVAIAWQEVASIQDVGQVVDGLWEITESGVRNAHIGYDRAIALGDTSWSDYEIQLSFVIEEITIEPRSFGWPSMGAAMHIATRWQGHEDWRDILPRRGWTAFGALFSYQINQSDSEQLIWIYDQDNDRSEKRILPKQLAQGKTYHLRARVVTGSEQSAIFSMKIWADTDAAEPDVWEITTEPMQGVIQHGSILLIAHQAIITFGDVLITSIE